MIRRVQWFLHDNDGGLKWRSFMWLTNDNLVLNSFLIRTAVCRLSIIPASNTILVTTIFQKYFVALMRNYQTCN